MTVSRENYGDHKEDCTPIESDGGPCTCEPRLRATVQSVDYGRIHHFVMMHLDGEHIGESREMTLRECEALRDRINEAAAGR